MRTGCLEHLQWDPAIHHISDKFEELRKIKDFFNIQVENPVAILNQDTSRNFLHSKSPFDKYKVSCVLLSVIYS